MIFERIFGKERNVIIGMVHCLPLPGTPRYSGDSRKIIDQAVADALTLERAGVDGIIVENMGDDPFGIEMDHEQAIALAAISALVKEKVKIPVGIDAAMNDYRTSISICKAIGGAFVRIPVFVDTVAFSGGIIQPCARQATYFRKHLDADDVAIFADIQVKHSHMVIPSVTIEDSARMAQDSGADAIIVTGTRIGVETPMDIIQRAKKVVNVPLIVASGVKESNIKQQMQVANGAIIGSSLKVGGVLSNPISFDLTNKLLDCMRS
jgi:membrane complex biogenesis BtpA family protein